MAEETGLNAPRRLKYGQRKASFSDTLNKLKTNSFTRRRTAPDLLSPKSTLSSSSSYTKIEPKQEQSQPQPRRSTPSRIPRSSSFFNSLNTFVPRGTTSHNNKESGNTKPNPVKQPRKITHRFSQPPSYFNSFPSQQDLTEPLIPKPKSNTQITQRALMQPFSNPPLPRRSTMGNLTQKPPTQTPGFMRPTSSSAARHNIGRAVSKSHALNKTMTTMTPNLPRSRRSEQFPPPTNFSLPSALRLPREPVQESTTPITSPKVSLERSERPKLDINSNLTFDELLRSITPEGEEAENVSGEITEVGETSDEKMTPEPIFAPSPHQVCLLAPLYLKSSLFIPSIFADSLLLFPSCHN